MAKKENQRRFVVEIYDDEAMAIILQSFKRLKKSDDTLQLAQVISFMTECMCADTEGWEEWMRGFESV